MSRKITWTEKQKEIAGLLRQGRDHNDLIQSGYGRATVFRVQKALKTEEKGKERQPVPQFTPESPPDTRVRIRTLDPVEVGGLYIEPADWRINQYGAFLIVNTHEYAKQKYGYSGTVGDFICECVQVMRERMLLDVMSFDYLLKEDGNGKEGDQGAGVLEETGDEPAETAFE
ncbi:MAG: hypothetical protein Q8P12_01060 [bacterium]|nr:hypothetical protein [bacterium]